MTAVLLAAGHSVPALSTPVAFTSTPARGVFLAAVAAATITGLPAPWQTVDYEVVAQGCLLAHLAAADNPGGATLVTLQHNGPRQCAFVVWEDTVAPTPAPAMASGLTEGAAQNTTLTATPPATTTGRGVAAAVFGLVFGGGDGTAYDPVSVDQGFTLLGDSDTTPVATEAARLVVAVRDDPPLAGQAVTLTAAAAVSRVPTNGILVYDLAPPPAFDPAPPVRARVAQPATRGAPARLVTAGDVAQSPHRPAPLEAP